MGWVMRIEHTNGYRYGSEVRSSYNEARMTTLTTERQSTLESTISVQPTCRPFRYVDYWCTIVNAFDIQVPHASLHVHATSVVSTTGAPALEPTVGWDDLAGDRVLDRWGEYLEPTTYVPADDDLAALGPELAAGRGVGDAVEAAVGWVSDSLEYRRGVTRVSTSAPEVLATGAGVCQDYAHLTLAVLRSMGVPARYTSGYLHPRADAVTGDAVFGESHAWVEAWIGHWYGFDPTSGTPAGERHAVVAYGRDYGDVPPLKGVYLGGPSEALEVSVAVTRLG